MLPQLSQCRVHITGFVVNEDPTLRFPRRLQIDAIVNENDTGTTFTKFLLGPARNDLARPVVFLVLVGAVVPTR